MGESHKYNADWKKADTAIHTIIPKLTYDDKSNNNGFPAKGVGEELTGQGCVGSFWNINITDLNPYAIAWVYSL